MKQFKPQQLPVVVAYNLLPDGFQVSQLRHPFLIFVLMPPTFAADSLHAFFGRLPRHIVDFAKVLNLVPVAVVEEEIERAGQQQGADRCQHPRLFLTDQTFGQKFPRNQVCRQRGRAERLQAKAIAHAECQVVVLKRGRIDDRVSGQLLESVEIHDFIAQVLAQVLLQARQLDRIAQHHDAADLGLAVDPLKKADRSLHLGQQIVEDRAHRLEHGLRVLGLPRVSLQVFGLGERELQVLGQLFGEVVSAQRDAPLPHAVTIGDDQVGRVGAHGQHDQRFGWIVRIEFLRVRAIAEQVVGNEVVDAERRQLDNVQLDSRVLERLDGAEHLFAFHREQADLGFEREAVHFGAAAHLLVVPDHVVQIERDLLARLVFHNVRNLLGVDRGRLEELGQPALTGNRNGHLVALHVVSAQKLLQRVAHQLLWVRFRLTQDLGVFDIVERIGDHFVAVARATQRLERALPDINPPHASISCHAVYPS